MSESPKQPRNLAEDARKLARYAAWIGAILALVCHLVPPHYRAACEALAAICRGGK